MITYHTQISYKIQTHTQHFNLLTEIKEETVFSLYTVLLIKQFVSHLYMTSDVFKRNSLFRNSKHELIFILRRRKRSDRWRVIMMIGVGCIRRLTIALVEEVAGKLVSFFQVWKRRRLHGD